MASFIKEVNPRLAKRPLKTHGRLANRGLTSLALKINNACAVYGANYMIYRKR